MKGGSASSSEETTMAGAALFSTISQTKNLAVLGKRSWLDLVLQKSI